MYFIYIIFHNYILIQEKLRNLGLTYIDFTIYFRSLFGHVARLVFTYLYIPDFKPFIFESS